MIALSLLTAGELPADPTATTASVTATADGLTLIWITLRASSDPAGGSITASGLSRTWVEVGRAGNPDRIGVLLRSQGSGASGTIDITAPGDTIGMQWAVFEATGVLVGNNGADAITNAATNGGTSQGAQPNLTIPGTPSAGDVTLAALLTEDFLTWTEEGGWAVVSELVGTSEVGHGVYVSSGQDQTFTVTGYDTGSPRDWGVVGCIVKAAASAAPVARRSRRSFVPIIRGANF